MGRKYTPKNDKILLESRPLDILRGPFIQPPTL